MKKITIILTAILFYLSNSVVLGQPDSSLIPSSPNANSLGTYGNVPVGLYNGTAQFQVPIYTIKTKYVEIPISLNYSSNGIRVDELPSLVGMGWSLNAGGVITRSTNHHPDNLDNRRTFPNCSISSQEMKDTIASYLNPNNDNDMQPDIFAFNFNGYTGKFFLDNNYKPVLIGPSPIKIEVFNGFDDNIDTLAFKITNQEGLVYYFGDEGAYETTYTTLVSSSGGGNPHINGPTKTIATMFEAGLME
jgi:hypothetical protein